MEHFKFFVLTCNRISFVTEDNELIGELGDSFNLLYNKLNVKTEVRSSIDFLINCPHHFEQLNPIDTYG
jgi:hypothetical protein